MFLFLSNNNTVMEIAIRPMKKSDLKKLAEIYVTVYDAVDIGEHWSPKAAEELLAYWLKKQPDLAFVAQSKGELVGAFVAGVKPWWDGFHLTDGEIFVRPDFQKKGVGTKLSIALYAKALEKYNAVSFDA